MLKLSIIVLLFASIGYRASSEGSARQSTTNDYYISSSEGSDDNDGSMTTPFETLDKISSVALVSGDKVYFKSGDRFDGHFVVNGSGTLEQPILLSAYGTGNKPIITGEVGAAGGGDYQEAILVQNNDHIVFDGLEVNNERQVTRSGIDDLRAYGIQVLNDGNRVLKNFVMRNMTIRNVYAVNPTLEPADFDGLEVAGIRFFSGFNSGNSIKNIQDILVEDSYFTDLQRFGVHVKQGGAATGVGDDMLNRNMNVICRNNEFSYLGGTSILPQRTYNCLIENNIFDHPGASVDSRMPGRGSSVWTFHCINTVIQYNQCLSTRGYFDSHGIHIDHRNVNTFIQYNYMEDCEGGFVEILKGNVNSVYRFNVSVNDGWRNGGGPEGAWANSNHTIWIDNGDNGQPGADIESCDGTYIYNNTVILDYDNVDDPNKKESTAIGMVGKNTFIFNNIFQSINGGEMGKQQVNQNSEGTSFFMSNNLFHGDVDARFKNLDQAPFQGDPAFVGIGDKSEKYDVGDGSVALDNGIAIDVPEIVGAGEGIFEDVTAYPEVDFFGNALGTEQNIGASNTKGEPLVLGFHELNGPFLIYPNPAKSEINLIFSTAPKGDWNVSLLDIRGVVLRKTLQASQMGSNYILRLDDSIPNGIYNVIINVDGLKYDKRIILSR